jgi:hypothetical protein
LNYGGLSVIQSLPFLFAVFPVGVHPGFRSEDAGPEV